MTNSFFSTAPSAPPSGITGNVLILRKTAVGDTALTEAKAVFTPGTSINAADLNKNQTQVLRAVLDLRDTNMSLHGRQWFDTSTPFFEAQETRLYSDLNMTGREISNVGKIYFDKFGFTEGGVQVERQTRDIPTDADLALKENITDVDAKLAANVVNEDAKLALKDDSSSVDAKLALNVINEDTKLSLKEDITSVNTKLEQNVINEDAKLALKDDITSVDAKLANKDDINSVDTKLLLKDDVTSVNNKLAQNVVGEDIKLALKEDITTVDQKLALNVANENAKLALKEDTGVVDTKLALKDDITSVDSKLATKADLSGGKLLVSQLPEIAVTDFLGGVANQSSMLALAGQKGDWCTRTDDGKIYIITGADPTLISDWTELTYPAAPVTSVAGRTGVVTLSTSDIAGLGTASGTASTDYATAAQGTLADSATQPADLAVVQADVDQNEADADAAIAAVQADVDQNEADADTAIAAVQADVDANEAAALAARNAIQADVDQNEADSDAAELALSNRLNTLEADPTTATAVAAVQADVDLNEANLATVATSGSYNDLTNKPTLGTAAATASTDYATAAQGSTADTAVQPGDLETVATSGAYSDLSGKPTIPTIDPDTVIDATYVATDNNFTNADHTKLDGIAAGAEVNVVASVASKTGAVTLVKGDVGLGNVDNTSDANKPVSTATQTALDAKADLVAGKLNTSQLPDIAIAEYKGNVSNQTAMLAISGEKGDWVIRNDDSKVYVITGTNPSVASDWTALSYPAGFSGAYNDLSGKPTLGTAAATASTDYATAAQGTLADSATQPADLHTVATSGSYNDLSSTPTIPTNNNQLTNGAGYITSADGGDATTLDGIDSSSFLRSDIDDNGQGFGSRGNLNSSGDSGLLILNGSRLGFDQSGTRSWTVKASGGNLNVNSGDGVGSLTGQINASTLDSIDSSSFLRSDADDTYSGNLTINGFLAPTGTNVTQNLKLRGGTTASTDAGISIFNGSNQWVTQLYGAYHASQPSYGFLSGNWQQWDLRKYVNGELQVKVGGTDYTVWHSGNDGSGSQLDADTLDGVEGANYLRSNQSDTFNGNLTVNNVSDSKIVLSGSSAPYIRWQDGTTNKSYLQYDGASGDVFHWNQNSNSGIRFGTNLQWYNGSYQTVWHSGNDGSGSGLDADLLDGYQSTNFEPVLATYGTTASSSGRIRCTAPFNTNSGHMFQVRVILYQSYNIQEYVVGGYMYSGTNQWYSPTCFYRGTGAPNIVVGRDSNGKAYISIADGNYTGVKVCDMTMGYYTSLADTYNQWTITSNSATENSVSPTLYTIWHNANDGSGSGLDADLLDGYHVETGGRNNNADRVVKTDSNGYLLTGWINTTSGDNSSAIPNRMYCSDDGYLRYVDLASFRSFMNVTAKTGYQGREQSTSDTNYWVGTMGWSNNNLNTVMNYGSGHIEGWSTPANAPSTETSHWVGHQSLHYSNGTNMYGHQFMVGAGNPAYCYLRGVWGSGFTSWAKMWNSHNDGAGSGLDADTLDGIESVNFMGRVNNYWNANNWIQFNSGHGLYYPNNYSYHVYPVNQYLRVRNNNTSNGIQVVTNNSQLSGYLYADSANQIGFLNNSGSWGFRMDSSGNCTATGNLTAYSDIRLKENIRTVDSALEKVKSMRGVYFDRKDTGKASVGVIAQEIEEILPEVVETSDARSDENTDALPDIKTVSYGNIVGVLIEAIKEQQIQIDELKAKLEDK